MTFEPRQITARDKTCDNYRLLEVSKATREHCAWLIIGATGDGSVNLITTITLDKREIGALIDALQAVQRHLPQMDAPKAVPDRRNPDLDAGRSYPRSNLG